MLTRDYDLTLESIRLKGAIFYPASQKWAECRMRELIALHVVLTK